ncbi:hypothetical protein F4813DRAFT_346997 [Daldinia decipiens]|uniref:uncharacterized protein n=1 Tax=Daldinia decipiens TaxID=326647 RepID=UPI0020C28FC4|nr:uncharacterized protein F4813DRAFT_346997 [Daldinia decipiens]KAI1661275.1 hypothetical protein F4813DRAFT_346997 [Daldinia decipiens]
MAHLPEGWESDYDGSRWLYRFKTTGLTQYHFPRPGDEFPELVGIGFGPLDFAPGNGLVSEYKVVQKGAPNVTSNDGKTALANGKDEMGATGYFDPDNFMYFGLNDISPVGNESSTTTNTTAGLASPVNNKSKALLAELESPQRWSPVGFVSELASSDTVKCAEELAPIEMDATQIAQTPLQPNIHQNGVAELSTERSPVEEKAPAQHPVRETMKPVEEYPLVSASFAYPPLKTTLKPAGGVQTETLQMEQKVIASQRPPAARIEQNEYETWKPTHGIANEELKNSYRNSITLSSISVLQSQNTELGPINQKRHSLSGPVESSEETHNLPGILRQPSDPRTSAIVSPAPPEVETSPIPTALQPAIPPTKATKDNSRPQPTQSGIPALPGSGARHESISYGSGVSIVNSGLARIPSVLRPAHNSNGTLGDQRPLQTHADIIRPGAHRVNTLPNQLSSHIPSPPKIGGPGIYVFQEIPIATESIAEQNKPYDLVTAPADSSGQGSSSQMPHQPIEAFHPIMDESLPVVAPLSLSRPQKPASPDRISNTSAQGSILNSPVFHNKPQRKPLGSQSTGNASPTSGTPMMGSTNIPIRPHPASQQGLQSSIGPPRPGSVPQARPHSTVPQVSSGKPPGQPTQAHNYQKPSISSSPQHSSQVSQSLSTAHVSLGSTNSQGQTVINSTYNAQAPVQRPDHGVPTTIQASGSFSAHVSSQPMTPQAIAFNQQRPPSNSSPSPRPQSSQQPGQNMPVGITIGQHKPQSPSPIAQPVSPLHSQVSSPAPSIASLHRPPSSASSHTYSTAQNIAGQNRPPNMTTHQNSPHVIRPTAAQASQVQGNQHVTQSPSPPITGGSKPFPMLPGQVKPLPSQVGSPHVLVQNQPAPTTTVQVQHIQGQTTLVKPTQQQPGSQQMMQAAVQKPPQQQLMNGNHVQLSGNTITGQPTQLIGQPGQPRPTIQGAPGQQQTFVQSPVNGQNLSTYMQQSMGNINQLSSGQNGQVVAGTTYGATTQSQISNGFQSSTTQQFAGQSMVQGQQQLTQPPGLNSNFPQISGQIKPFTSTQAAAALSDAGKKMKKWAKKTWQNPALKQSSAAIGGAIIAESIGMNGLAGASLGNNIYNSMQNKPQGQPQGQLQGSQQQRPPGLQHAYTTPPQTQVLQGGGITSPQTQAMNRPQLQQGLQPAGVQTPGRPPIVQNPGMTGTPVNYNATQPNMANQQAPYQIPRPPVGRPPLSQMQQQQQLQQQQQQQLQQQQLQQLQQQRLQQQMQQQIQQSVAFGQSVFQGPSGQPLYQVRPNQAAYQMPPGQPGYQGQGQEAADPYAAIGATIGGALTAFAGNKTDTPASTAQQHQAANTEQHHTQHSEPQHETYSEQQHGGQSEQHHAEQSEQNHGGYSEQQYTNQSEQHQESHYGHHQEAQGEAHQQAYAEQNYTNHDQQQNNGYTNEDRQAYSEPAPAESHATSESYYAPQPESTIINNTTINNIENTAIAESTQTNTNYTDNTQISDTNQMNMNYTDNSQVENTTNTDMTNTETTAFTDTAYIDTMNSNTNTEATAYAEATYMDSSNTNMDMNADMTAYADTTAYADASYADANAMYIDVNVDMNVDINQTTYMGDETSMMTMEENFSMDAGATYMETSTVDYSGGDWGGGGEW